MGLRQGRHGDDQLRDRRRRARGRRDARLRRAGRRDRARARACGSRTARASAPRTVVCNADPKVALRPARRPGRARRLPRRASRRWKVRSPVVKFNAALERAARAGPPRPARRGRRARRSTSPAASRTPSAAFEALRRAASPPSASARSTSRPATTRRPAPEGNHLLSVFGQYAPYELADGDWDSRRDEVARQFIDLIDRFAPGFEDRLERLRGARPARHRGAHRPHRRQHLPGRGDARPDVGAPADAAHAGRRASTSAAPRPTPAGA